MKTYQALIVSLYAVVVAAYVYYIIRHDKHYRKNDNMLFRLCNQVGGLEMRMLKMQEEKSKPTVTKRARKKK
jgi:hypothetical protein